MPLYLLQTYKPHVNLMMNYWSCNLSENWKMEKSSYQTLVVMMVKEAHANSKVVQQMPMLCGNAFQMS